MITTKPPTYNKEPIIWLEKQVSIKRMILREGLALIIIIGVMTTSFLLTPDSRGIGTHEQLHLAPCLFHLATGKPCPTCGLTTSFAAMAHGNYNLASKAHYFGPALFFLSLSFGVFLIYSLSTRKRLRASNQLATTLPFYIVGVLLLYGIIRIITWR